MCKKCLICLALEFDWNILDWIFCFDHNCQYFLVVNNVGIDITFCKCRLSLLNKALLFNDIFTFHANIKYHGTFSSSAVIKLFLEMSKFKNYLFEISNFKEIMKGRKINVTIFCFLPFLVVGTKTCGYFLQNALGVMIFALFWCGLREWYQIEANSLW